MSFDISRLGLLFGLNFHLTSMAMGQPVTEQIDRFELNWSTMRIRFYGETTVDFSQKGFESAEKTATEDGLKYAHAAMAKIRNQKSVGEQNLALAADELTKQAYLYNTIYFTDGRVRVELESSLAKAFDLGSDQFVSEEPTAPVSDASSIVIQVSGLKAPLLRAEIQSTDGEKLFSSRDVTKAAYKKNMLGRWFFRNSSELRSFQGANPVMVEAVAQGDQSLIVTKESWNRLKTEHRRLLEEAKLAYVIAGPAKSAAKSTAL